MSAYDIEKRRQAWLAFASAAVSGYQGLDEKYKDADQFVTEMVHNSCAIADDMLGEFLKRDKDDFILEDEEDDEDEEREEEEEEVPTRGRRRK